MPKKFLSLSGFVLVMAISSSQAFADYWKNIPLRPQPPGAPAGAYTGMPRGAMPVREPIQQVSGVRDYGNYGGQFPSSGQMMMPTPQRYPQMHAPMYPCPVPNVPVQVGGTTISNQAFAPHEMMYAHKYKAMFPPFYYKVSGGWLKTPWGMESHDKWVLQGTEVKVNYRDRYSWFSGFHPPVLR